MEVTDIQDDMTIYDKVEDYEHVDDIASSSPVNQQRMNSVGSNSPSKSTSRSPKYRQESKFMDASDVSRKWLMIHTQSGISTNRENAPITLEDVNIEETYTSSDSTNTSVSQDESIYMEYISDSRQNVPIHDTITNHTQVSSTSYVPDFVSHIPISNNPTDNYQIREILNRQLSAVVAQLVKIGMGPYTVNNVLTNAKSQIEQSGLIWY